MRNSFTRKSAVVFKNRASQRGVRVQHVVKACGDCVYFSLLLFFNSVVCCIPYHCLEIILVVLQDYFICTPCVQPFPN